MDYISVFAVIFSNFCSRFLGGIHDFALHRSDQCYVEIMSARLPNHNYNLAHTQYNMEGKYENKMDKDFLWLYFIVKVQSWAWKQYFNEWMKS